MAKKDKNKDEDDAEAGGSSKLKLIIIILLGTVLVAGLGIGGTLYFMGLDSAESVAEEVDAEADATDEEGAENPKKNKKKDNPDEPPIFESMDPKFVVSFKDQNSARFMQLSIEFMARDQEIIDLIKNYKPMIRSKLVLLLSDQTFDQVTTSAGKEALLQLILDASNNILDEQAGNPGIESVYFSSFVAQ